MHPRRVASGLSAGELRGWPAPHRDFIWCRANFRVLPDRICKPGSGNTYGGSLATIDAPIAAGHVSSHPRRKPLLLSLMTTFVGSTNTAKQQLPSLGKSYNLKQTETVRQCRARLQPYILDTRFQPGDIASHAWLCYRRCVGLRGTGHKDGHPD